jgi:hypothetical protein
MRNRQIARISIALVNTVRYILLYSDSQNVIRLVRVISDKTKTTTSMSVIER